MLRSRVASSAATCGTVVLTVNDIYRHGLEEGSMMHTICFGSYVSARVVDVGCCVLVGVVARGKHCFIVVGWTHLACCSADGSFILQLTDATVSTSVGSSLSQRSLTGAWERQGGDVTSTRLGAWPIRLAIARTTHA